MPISYTYNTIFIHIPKCAGTTIEKILGTCTPSDYFAFFQKPSGGVKKTPQHFTYLDLKNDLDIDWSNFYTFSVVRNPYERFVSEYKYRKHLFNTTRKPRYNPSTFDIFVEKLKMEQNERIISYDNHLETQSSFLKNENGVIEPSIQVFKFENLSDCFDVLETKTGVKYGNYLWSRKSMDETPYDDFFTEKTKSDVYNFYKEDFDNFGYSSEL